MIRQAHHAAHLHEEQLGGAHAQPVAQPHERALRMLAKPERAVHVLQLQTLLLAGNEHVKAPLFAGLRGRSEPLELARYGSR